MWTHWGRNKCETAVSLGQKCVIIAHKLAKASPRVNWVQYVILWRVPRVNFWFGVFQRRKHWQTGTIPFPAVLPQTGGLHCRRCRERQQNCTSFRIQLLVQGQTGHSDWENVFGVILLPIVCGLGSGQCQNVIQINLYGKRFTVGTDYGVQNLRTLKNKFCSKLERSSVNTDCALPRKCSCIVVCFHWVTCQISHNNVWSVRMWKVFVNLLPNSVVCKAN